MVKDLSPDWGNNQTIPNFNALRDAIEDKDWKKGHIVLEGDNFRIDDEEEFEGEEIQSEDDLKPIVIKAKSIGGATIKGNGSLVFKKTKDKYSDHICLQCYGSVPFTVVPIGLF